MKPQRIQRKRTKGWRMPENTVYVGRGSKYGNPYRIGVDGNAEECVAKFRDLIMYLVMPSAIGQPAEMIPMLTPAKTPLFYMTEKGLIAHPSIPITRLRGKNLACWCKEGEACHADVLLEIANK